MKKQLFIMLSAICFSIYADYIPSGSFGSVTTSSKINGANESQAIVHFGKLNLPNSYVNDISNCQAVVKFQSLSHDRIQGTFTNLQCHVDNGVTNIVTQGYIADKYYKFGIKASSFPLESATSLIAVFTQGFDIQ